MRTHLIIAAVLSIASSALAGCAAEAGDESFEQDAQQSLTAEGVARGAADMDRAAMAEKAILNPEVIAKKSAIVDGKVSPEALAERSALVDGKVSPSSLAEKSAILDGKVNPDVTVAREPSLPGSRFDFDRGDLDVAREPSLGEQLGLAQGPSLVDNGMRKSALEAAPTVAKAGPGTSVLGTFPDDLAE